MHIKPLYIFQAIPLPRSYKFRQFADLAWIWTFISIQKGTKGKVDDGVLVFFPCYLTLESFLAEHTFDKTLFSPTVPFFSLA